MAGLSISTSAALSSLRAIQVQLALASANLANADTEGYTTKTATQTSTVTSGVGTGTTITAISSSVDMNLVRALARATADNGGAEVTEDYLEQLADILGTLSSDSDESGDTLATTLAELESALDELATTPESATLANQVAQYLEQITGDLRDTSAEIQELRASADADIESTVNEVNEALELLDDLNEQIVTARSMGQSTADLEDQRRTALLTVAAAVDVDYTIDDAGRMLVFTAGQPLVTASGAHTLAYTAAATVTSETVFGAITLDGKDITASLGDGSLGALVELRDETLPAVQDQLDALAVDLADTLNAAANEGTAIPAPATLTSTLEASAADAFAGTGTVRIAVADADGVAVSVTDIDLSAYTTVGDLVTALDAIDGLSASIDADGHVVLSADDSANGVAIAGMDSSVGTDGEGFSAHFGFNDLLVGDGAESLTVRESLTADTGLLPVGVVSSGTTTPATGDTVISTGSGSLATAMADALREADLTTEAATIVSDASTRLGKAETAAQAAETRLTTLTDTFSSKYGVNVDEETARISALEDAYAASAQILSAVDEMFQALLDAVS